MPRKHKLESAANATTVTDEGLILRVSHGDARAFETLVDLYQKSALRMAQRCIAQQAEAEDPGPGSPPPRSSVQSGGRLFQTWFFSILINLCRNAVERNRSLSFVELPEDATTIDDPESDLAYEEELVL